MHLAQVMETKGKGKLQRTAGNQSLVYIQIKTCKETHVFREYFSLTYKEETAHGSLLKQETLCQVVICLLHKA